MDLDRQISLGSKVYCKNKLATIKYIGPTIISKATWYGIEFKKKVGDNNGTLAKTEYFRGKEGHCKFVLIDKLTVLPKKKRFQIAKKSQDMRKTFSLQTVTTHKQRKKKRKKKSSQLVRKRSKDTNMIQNGILDYKIGIPNQTRKRSKTQYENKTLNNKISINFSLIKGSKHSMLQPTEKKEPTKSLKKQKKRKKSLSIKLDKSNQYKKELESDIYYYNQYLSKILTNKTNEEEEKFDEQELLEIEKDEKEEEELQELMREIHKLKKKEEKIDKEEKQTQNEIQNFCIKLANKSNLIVASKIILKQQDSIKSAFKYEELLEKNEKLSKEIQQFKTLMNTTKKSHEIEMNELFNKINIFEREIAKYNERSKNFGNIENQSKLKIDQLENDLQSLKNHIFVIKRKILDLEMNKDDHFSKMDSILEYYDQVDRSDWSNKLNVNNPEIKDLRERINPLKRALSFANCYSGSKTLIEKELTNKIINQLILQHLEFENQKECKKIIEEVTLIPYHEIHLHHSRLKRLLRISIKEVERLWNLLMNNDYYSKKSLEERKIIFEEKIDDLGLDLINVENDINIWDEAPDNKDNIRYKKAKTTTGQENPEIIGKGSFYNIAFENNDIDRIHSHNYDNDDIQCANINKLVEKLTDKSTQVRFRDAFIMTYQSFMKPNHLLAKLKERYNVPLKPKQIEDINEQNWKIFKDTIQVRVISVLNNWIKTGWADIDQKILIRIIDFINTTISKDKKKSGEKLLNIINTKKNEKKEIEKKRYSMLVVKVKPPDVIIPKNIFSPNFSLLDLTEEEFARQFTLLISQAYQKIKPSELITGAWKRGGLKSKAPNVILMINKFNEYTNYIATQIVQPMLTKDRAKYFSRFLKIGKFFLEMNNYDSLMATIVACTHPAVKRLKNTLKEVPKNIFKYFNEFKSILKYDSGFKEYKQMIESKIPPLVPYLIVFLTEISYISNNFPDKIDGLINFSKRKLLYNVVIKIQQYQRISYKFYPIHQIQVLLKRGLPVKTEKELFQISLKREPRN
ncbi:ras guanine nucleotide exchange factor a [Anaeramoeba flamelloides]|uniref:Ras guanine nucleotide exchange factor a n=1 Tax=Anaeramoeba flamelloides TaxID=1746091 RepID=A0AAV7ZP60_9EUKA|nr:ras guanine nucleotide exchange factor a [Anaeramoeba flamelloides]